MTIAASPGQLVIEPDQQFILTNNGDTTLKFTYAGRTYIVQSNEHKVVPFDVIRLYFGDPRSVVGIEQKYERSQGEGGPQDLPTGNIAKRENEIQRLAILYGLYAGNEAKIPDLPQVNNVKVETLDRIEIFCPAVDPEGIMTYAHREASNNVQDTATLLAQMQRKMEQQQAMIDELRGMTQDPSDDDEMVPDGPRFPE